MPGGPEEIKRLVLAQKNQWPEFDKATKKMAREIHVSVVHVWRTEMKHTDFMYYPSYWLHQTES